MGMIEIMDSEVLHVREINISDDSHTDLDIILSPDERYMNYAGVCIYSIKEKNPHLKLRFHIFTESLKDEDACRFNEMNENISIYIIDNSELSKQQKSERFPTSIYYRIIAPRIINKRVNNLEKLLYIDCDTLCSGSLSELVNMELNDKNSIYACIDKNIECTNFIEKYNLKSKGYFNSGVILINVKTWLSKGIENEFFNRISGREYKYPDQDCLNIILDGEFGVLDETYNFIPKNNIEQANGQTIIHYAGQIKPWCAAASENKLNIEYLKKYKESPWGEIPLILPKSAGDALVYSKKLIKKGMIKNSIYWFLNAIRLKIIENHSNLRRR